MRMGRGATLDEALDRLQVDTGRWEVMGGRSLPQECSHGKLIDGGDFGPDEPCEECETSQDVRLSDADVLEIAEFLDLDADQVRAVEWFVELRRYG